jgi:glycosyltransferase involved in cell wall biosynthesis
VPIAAELVVLAQDPRFGGGSAAQTSTFLDGAHALGQVPKLLYDEHPGLGDRRLTWRRVEALRQLAAARELESQARTAASLWVVAALAHHGGAAARSRRPYGCWVGTTIRSEWAGRAPGLPAWRRAAAGIGVPALVGLERRVLRGATRLYATSQASRRDVAGVAGIPEHAVEIIPIPVDLERFAPAPDDVWREAAARPALVFVGRADDPRKNVPMLLDAFAVIRRRFPRALLRLVGRPPLGRLPEGVEAVGEVGDVSDELRSAALFVLPSRQEGFGIVAAEAMAAGLPVVTTPSGGPEDLVGRSGGGLVAAAHTAPAFAAAVESVITDDESLFRMRKSGRLHVETEHGPEVFRQALASALAEVERA